MNRHQLASFASNEATYEPCFAPCSASPVIHMFGVGVRYGAVARLCPNEIFYLSPLVEQCKKTGRT